jgi:nucleoside triphosphate diphosphatase
MANSSKNKDAASIERLIEIMARLRDPKGGCPWDLEQNFATIAPYTLEEAYEVADAISRGNMEGLKDELGDLLFQVVFHAQMAKDAGLFEFSDVAASISDKMVRRHPHVFGDTKVANAAEQTTAWEDHKAKERAKQPGAGALDGVPLALPALLRAIKLQKRAALVGFDWKDATPILEKLNEEISELISEMKSGAPAEKINDEFGDILFVCVNLARHLQVDPETALRSTNDKFVRRFKRVEEILASRGKTAAQSTLEEMDALWTEVKREERSGKPPT